MLFHIKRHKKWSFLYQKDNLRTRNEGNVNPAQGKSYLQVGLKDHGVHFQVARRCSSSGISRLNAEAHGVGMGSVPMTSEGGCSPPLI